MLLGFSYNGAKYYYVRNLQSDIIGILDNSGNQVVSYTYDSWGKLLSIDGSAKDTIGVQNPFRYRGYYYDTETELYYLNSRYYDPMVGRFLNQDKFIYTGTGILGFNMFLYCLNNPVNQIDSYGERSYFFSHSWEYGSIDIYINDSRDGFEVVAHLYQLIFGDYNSKFQNIVEFRLVNRNTVLQIDNQKYGFTILNMETYQRYNLGRMMFDFATFINPDGFDKRTAVGIARELTWHVYGKYTIPLQNFNVTDIGGYSNDGNAWLWEEIPWTY